MQKNDIERAPSKITNKEVFRTYYELGRAVNSISDFLRDKGYIDYKKCAIPFTKQHGCTVCIKESTFFKAKYEKIRNGYMKKQNLGIRCYYSKRDGN